MSLKAKYALWTSLLLVVVLGFFSWRNYLLEGADLREDHRERVTLLTEVIKNGLVTSMLEGRGREFQKFLEAMVAGDVREVRIFSEDGEIVASSIPAQIGERIYQKDMEIFHGQSEPEVFSHNRDDGEEFYSMVVPIYNEPPCQRCHGSDREIRGILDVEVSMGRTNSRLRYIGLRSIATFLLTLVVLGFGLFVLTNRLVDRPLGEIIRTMRAAERGDLSVRHQNIQGDEIGKLASSLNDMLGKLERAYRMLEDHHAKELQKVERMATIGQLASAVAHEIKNPLAGISGAVQVLADDFGAEDPRHGIIEEVLEEITRLDKSVRDLLAYARPARPHLIVAGIPAVLERTVTIMGAEAEKRGVEIRMDVDADMPDTVIDPDQMQQVFMNLVKNAFHSAPASGGRIEITGGRKDDILEVFFRDNGPGVPPEMRADVFQPFFTTKRAGTGLGLAISKSIVEKHGGTITVDDVPEGGTRFRVVVPIKERGEHG